jgi:ATP-dependent exoDNAse (exonuclease V) beta subunit
LGNLKIYQSSAGSGKTYTLVKEYLLLVLKSPAALKGTLAVTFTNAATGEMKERLILALWQLATGRNEKLKSDLASSLGTSFNIEQAAAKVLNYAIHHYTDISISTIDSFFLNITRSIAYESRLPGRYEIDLNTEPAIDFMVQNILHAAGTDVDITNWLIDFAMHRVDSNKGWNMQGELKTIAKEVFKDHIRVKFETDVLADTSVINEVKGLHAAIWNKLSGMAKKFLEIANSVGAESKDFYFGEKGFYSLIKKIAAKEHPKDNTINLRTWQILDRKNVFADKAHDFLKQDQNLNSELLGIVRQIVDCYVESVEQLLSAEVVTTSIYQAVILKYLFRQLKVYRKDHQMLLMSDVGKILNSIIGDNDTPFIYEKAGNKYRNFLIDEFQDTSQVHWKNLLPLLINSLAEQHQVLTVGDGKQSIYRWRGGDMNLLLNEVEGTLKNHANSTDVFRLDSNFRSSVSVVEFNNIFFSAISEIISTDSQQSQLLKAAYQENTVHQIAKRSDEKGFVSIELFTKDESYSELHYPEYFSAADKVIASHTLSYIQSQIEKGYKPGDIALLVRSNINGNRLADFLVLNGYKNINSRDSLLICHAPQIRFLINCLRLNADNENQVAEKSILYFVSKHLQMETKVIETCIEKYVKHSKLYSLTEFCTQVINKFGLNKQPDAYLQCFEDLIFQKSNKGINTVAEFLDWWDVESNQNKISVQVPADENALTIITIHKSKGLQFPIVIIPYADWDLNSSKGLIWIRSDVSPFDKLGAFPVLPSKKLLNTYFREAYILENREKVLEEINTLYVACTRAEDKLFILISDSGKESEDGISKVNTLIKSAIINADTVSSVLTKASDAVFNMGVDSKYIHKRKKAADVPDSFTHKELINYYARENRISTGFKIKKFAEQSKSRLIGIKVHELLADFRSEADLEKIENHLSNLQIPDEEKNELLNGVKATCKFLSEKKWVSPYYQIYNEHEMADAEGNILRPDRLMLEGDKAIVVDYKTGAIEADHVHQIANYKEVLQDAGFKVVKTFLYYLEKKELIEA